MFRQRAVSARDFGTLKRMGLSAGGATLPIQAALVISGSLQGIAALKGSVVLLFGAESCFTPRLLAAGSSTSCFAALRSSLAEIIGKQKNQGTGDSKHERREL